MNIIVCVDDNKGMLFNHRRQSKDLKVIEKIQEVSNTKLWINEFSKKLFDQNVIVDEEMLAKAENGDYCFVENLLLDQYRDRIEKIYIFNWNRAYPSDFSLDLNLDQDFLLESEEEFVGNSHEKITLEVYRHV